MEQGIDAALPSLEEAADCFRETRAVCSSIGFKVGGSLGGLGFREFSETGGPFLWVLPCVVLSGPCIFSLLLQGLGKFWA